MSAFKDSIVRPAPPDLNLEVGAHAKEFAGKMSRLFFPVPTIQPLPSRATLPSMILKTPREGRHTRVKLPQFFSVGYSSHCNRDAASAMTLAYQLARPTFRSSSALCSNKLNLRRIGE